MPEQPKRPGRKAVHSSATARVAARDTALVQAGGRILKVRLSAGAAADLAALRTAGDRTDTAAIARALAEARVRRG